MGGEAAAKAERIRLDKWLFFARFAKSRAVAVSMIEAGCVRINSRKVDGAAAPVRAGDVLTLTLPQGVSVIRVLALGTRRGPPAEARMLHEPAGPAAPAA